MHTMDEILIFLFFNSFMPDGFFYLNSLDRSISYIEGFVCVEVLRPSQPNGVMSSAVSLPNHTFTGQA